MRKNKVLSKITQLLKDWQVEAINQVLLIDKDLVRLMAGGEELLKIDNHSLILAQKIDLADKIMILDSKIKTNLSLAPAFKSFYQELSKSITRLNHLGIGYNCESVREEAERYKQLLRESGLSLYEEKSGDKKVKWLFVGKEAQDQPLFEISLSEYPYNPRNEFMPHFQLDVDTELSFKQLQKRASKHLGRDFFSWKLDVLNVGVVLCMGLLENIQGTKIWVGFGTNLRKNLRPENFKTRL